MSSSTFREVVERLVRQKVSDEGGSMDVIVGEFVLIAATNGWDEEGEDVSQVVVVPDGGSEHRILGLIAHAHIRMEADVLSGYGE